MAILDPDLPFNPDEIDAAVVGIALKTVKHDSGEHRHERAQLLYAAHGCMRISLAGRHTVLPPGRAAWIPAGVSHSASMRNVVHYRSLYFDPTRMLQLPGSAKVVRLNPLLHALAERVALWPWEMPAEKQQTLLALFWEELAQAKEEKLTLALPTDSRLAAWLDALQQGQLTAEPLNVLVGRIGASEKTISRIFSRDTGLPYQGWRQQWRLLRSVELLCSGHSLSHTAAELGFCSDSAFIAFFRQQLGVTPKQFLIPGG